MEVREGGGGGVWRWGSVEVGSVKVLGHVKDWDLAWLRAPLVVATKTLFIWIT